jgi:translocation and assembly module TamB
MAPGPGELSLDARARIPAISPVRDRAESWPIASGALEGELALRGSWENPRGGLRFAAADLTPSAALGALPPGPYQGRGEARLEGDRLELQALEVNGPDARLSLTGAVTGLPAPAKIFEDGAFKVDGRLALAGKLALDDLSWLGRRLKDIRRTAGRFEAAFKVDGPFGDPQVLAEIRLFDGELRPESGFPPLQALGLEARTDGRDLQILALQGELGGAPFRVSGKIADLAHGGRFDLRLDGDNLLLHRSEAATLRADTHVRLNGPLAGLRLEGRLSVADGRFSKHLGLLENLLSPEKPKRESGLMLFSIQTPPLQDMVFDLRIDAARPFQVRTNVARGDLRPDLALTGTGRFPALTGVVYLESGRLSLPAGRVELESGMVRLLSGDPERPVLDLNGRSRIYGYDISMMIAGPYDEPVITLSSIPPLPHEELLFMLLTGQPPRQAGARDAGGTAGMKVAVFVGRDFVTRWLDSAAPESEEFILERFDVQVGRALTQAGDETIDASFRLVDGLVGRDSTLFLTGEKDAYDFYNAGVRLVFRFR